MKTEKNGFVEKAVKWGIYGVSTLMVGSGVVLMAPMTMAETSMSADSEVVVTLNPTISLGVYSNSGLTIETDEVSLGEVTPTAAGAWVEGDAYVGVATNNASGYTLKMTMVTNETSTALKPETDGIDTTIAATASAVSSDDMVKDHWGYKGGNLSNYNGAVLAANLGSAPVIAATNGPNAGMAEDAVKMTFGAKISTATVADTYSNVVMFTAVANSINGS